MDTTGRKRKVNDPEAGDRILDPNAPAAGQIPPNFKTAITNLGGSEPVLLAELTSSDIADRKNDDYFLISIQEINKHPILTEAQRNSLENGDAEVGAICIQPPTVKSKISISKHDNSNYALSGWKDLVKTHMPILTTATQLQLWSFKTIQLGFIMLLEDDSQEIQHQTKAQEVLPDAIKHRISSIGGSEPLFVVEKKLVKSDTEYRFAIPSRTRENEFLKEEEQTPFRVLFNRATIEAVLIGSSANEEFRVNLKKQTSMYSLGGDDWSKFVGKYGLKVGKKVRLWTFRPANESAGLDIGSYRSEPGFAWVTFQ